MPTIYREEGDVIHIERSNTLGDKLKCLGVATFVGLTIVTIAAGSFFTRQREADEVRMSGAIARYADTNRDGKTSMSEWGAVYAELNVPFNERTPVPLTYGQMKDFTTKHNINCSPSEVSLR